MKTEINLESRLLPAMVLLIGIMQVFDSSSIWMILLVALGGLWLVSYLWVKQLARNLTVKREIRFGWAQVGDILEERFTLYNKGILPVLWVEIIDHSAIPGYNSSVVSQVAAQSKNQFKSQGICSKRGLFTLGPTSLLSSDPFGIYTVQIHDPASTTLMVTPPVVPLPDIHVAAGGRAGAGRRRPAIFEHTVSTTGVREYIPGDSLHMIHWRTSARKNDLFVRIFDSTPASDWWIFIDMNSRVQVGEGWDSTLEHAIVMGASLTDYGLTHGKSVGLASNSREPIWLSPQSSEQQLWAILRSLALAESSSQTAGDWLALSTPALGRRTSLVVITPDVQGGWIESLIPLIWRDISPTIIILDPRSYGGPGDPNPILKELTRLGIPSHVITAELLDKPEARPGKAGRWEWRITPTGRSIPVKRPENMDWKSLA